MCLGSLRCKTFKETDKIQSIYRNMKEYYLVCKNSQHVHLFFAPKKNIFRTIPSPPGHKNRSGGLCVLQAGLLWGKGLSVSFYGARASSRGARTNFRGSRTRPVCRSSEARGSPGKFRRGAYSCRRSAGFRPAATGLGSTALTPLPVD